MNTNRLLKIVLIEDNADHAELVQRSFENHAIRNQILHVRDGEQALDLIAQRGVYSDAPGLQEFHLVLLDLRLPRVDGLDVLAAIKTSPRLARVPVVVLTTSEAERDLARAYELQANAYVVKPIAFRDFQQLMTELGLFWLAWNHGPGSTESVSRRGV